MIDAILKGLALGLILTISVGPVIFTIIKQSINNGRMGGFSFVVGVWLSDILLVIMSNMFSAWVTELMEYKKLIAYVGSTFLVLTGIYFVFFKKAQLRTGADGKDFFFNKTERLKSTIYGFVVNTLNPSIIFFWLINATAFAANHTLHQRIMIFSVCLLVNMSSDVAKVLMAEKLSVKLTLKNVSIINKLSGTILIGFAAALFYGARYFSDKI